MSRTKKFLLNSGFAAFGQIIVMIVGFITPRIMLNTYGSEINGLISSITQFIVYFNLVEAGLSTAAAHALYLPLANNDHDAINGVVTAAKKFYIQSGAFFILLTVVLAVCYPLYLKSDALSPVYIGILVLILGVNGALEFLTLAKYRVLLTADQKSYVISILSIINIVINTTIIIVLAEFNVNIVLLRFIALFSIFVRSLLLLIYCKRKYPFLDYKVKPNTSALTKRWDALIYHILNAVQHGSQVVLLTVISKDLKIVSVYSIFNMVLSGVLGVWNSFAHVLIASFGDIMARKEVQLLQKSFKEFELAYFMIITVIYSVTFTTIMPFINIYTRNIPDTQYDLPIVGFLFVLSGLLYGIQTPPAMLLISAGLFKETKSRAIIHALIAIVSGSILTPFLGIYGVLIGSILSHIYRNVDLMIFSSKNITKISVSLTVIRIFRIFICTVVSTVPFLFVKYTPQTFAPWIVYAIVAGIYSLLVTFIINLIFDKKEVINVIFRIKSAVLKQRFH